MNTNLNIIKTTLFGLALFSASSIFADQIDLNSSFDMQDHKGKTYLSFMKEEIKPALDDLSVNGYEVKGPETVREVYELVASKIHRKMNRSWGGLDSVERIASELEGQTVTLDNLHNKIRGVDSSVDPYGLSTFLGLVSGGGVQIKYFENNYSLNIHYDKTEQRSGRSFGVGPTRKANDASDKQYLDDIQHYFESDPDNIDEFMTALFESLLNSDSSGYAKVSEEGQTVLTDFLSVFTAEQARNLMDNKISPHWDAALLEVTLLAAFHAGQSEFKLFYKDPQTGKTSFTTETYKQTPCKVPERTKSASMNDYWQFSKNTDNAQHCRRSGINITKRDFRKLGKIITKHVRYESGESHYYEAIKNALELDKDTDNVFKSLSYYLISSKSPESLSTEKVKNITKAYVDFLNYVYEQADQIGESITR